MKFSDIEESAWSDLQPYVDSCILPITGLTGKELPWEATQALESLRDALDCLEIPYKGRVLTYPAFHFIDEASTEELLTRIFNQLKQSFRYVIAVTANETLASSLQQIHTDATFIITPKMLADSKGQVQQEVAAKLQQLWAAR